MQHIESQNMTNTDTKTSPRINPHKVFKEQVELAKIYLEDGAFYTAADKLRQLAASIDDHIDDVNREFGVPTRADIIAMRAEMKKA